MRSVRELVSGPTLCCPAMHTAINAIRARAITGVRPRMWCGNGGHPPLQKLSVDTTLRTPITMPGFAQKTMGDTVTLDNYDFKSFGYLRIEYHPEGDGVTVKTPDDFVPVQLSDTKLIHYIPPST